MSPGHQIFLLSPANCAGKRAGFLLRREARSALAQRLRSDAGTTIGEVFTFMSGLYFRGKLTYAEPFADPPDRDHPIIGSGVHVITPNSGLRTPDTWVTSAAIRQFAAVDEILSGRENLVMVAQLRHLKGPDRIADELLDRFSLTDAAARKVSTYSGGMRRRLDIAMSLIGNPSVMFLDEPTNGLDPQARIEVWQAVKELAEHGTTVLLTTQYLDEAEQLADRIAILHGGRIVVNGTLAELKQLLPPAKIEYVEKQPTLEDVFLAIVADDGNNGDAGTE